MKQVAGGLRLDMAAFRELAAFAQFGTSLDETTQGARPWSALQEILKQPPDQPVSLADQVLAIYGAPMDTLTRSRWNEWPSGKQPQYATWKPPNPTWSRS